MDSKPEPEGSRTVTGHARSQGGVGLDYIPTDEERRVFTDCNQESFWYRSVPISISSMAVTQFLISRGTLTSSTRFGSAPKVLFAGVCGYIAGKLSYMKACQEKFKRLENSPLGDAIRQKDRLRPPLYGGQSELSDSPVSSNQKEPQFNYSDRFSEDDETLKNETLTEKPVKKNIYGDTWEN